LVLPYLLLSVATAMVGTFVVTRLVTSSLRERFANQLLEASRVAADSFVRLEEDHLAKLRALAFTQGVAQAAQQGDVPTVQSLLFPVVANDALDLVSVVQPDGVELLTLIRDPASGEYAVSSGNNLEGPVFLDLVRMGYADDQGDKYSWIVGAVGGYYIVTAGPLRTPDGVQVGAIMDGTRLQGFLERMKEQVLADVLVLDSDGVLVASTVAIPLDEARASLELAPSRMASLVPGQDREVTLGGRSYQVYYSPLRLRGMDFGALGVVLPSNFVVSTEATSRNLFSVIFALGCGAVILVGIFQAGLITRPIKQLQRVSLAVASGDLTQRAGIQGPDEIGQFATVFDLMTSRLDRRTKQAARLHEETAQRNAQLREANLRLQQTQQQLVQSEKLAAVGQLTAGIVHDVKNPLSVIKGNAEDLKEQMAGNPVISAQIEAISRNADRANRIVGDLLTFARQSDAQMQRQDLGAIVEACVRLTEYLIRKGKVRVSTDLGPLPVMATFDSLQIEQVVVNMIQNAIQAMPGGGLLRLAVTEEGPWAKITIQDTGKGIAPEHLDRIFDPLFTTKPAGEGTGLGLSVSYGIISQHKGRIEVKSGLGMGTTFTIWLPLSQEAHGN
jgi:signal transduction histidine kinase